MGFLDLIRESMNPSLRLAGRTSPLGQPHLVEHPALQLAGPGLVTASHGTAAEAASQHARELKALGGGDRQAQAAILVAKAAKIDCGPRHQNLAKKYSRDERFITSCNLEDAVIYFKYLLENTRVRWIWPSLPTTPASTKETIALRGKVIQRHLHAALDLTILLALSARLN